MHIERQSFVVLHRDIDSHYKSNEKKKKLVNQFMCMKYSDKVRLFICYGTVFIYITLSFLLRISYTFIVVAAFSVSSYSLCCIVATAMNERENDKEN